MATIKDVARLAGVGVGTASRAISGRGAVAPQTLQRVQQAVRALNFRPSTIARALSSKKLGMVGVYVAQFSGWFYGPMLSAIDAQLRESDTHMVTVNGCGHGDPRQQALDGVDFLIQRECDGILVVSNDLSDAELLDARSRCERMVVLNRRVRGMASQCFTSDHELAGRLAARALLVRGHREIATIGGPDSALDNVARMKGFHDELRLHGVSVLPQHQVDGDFHFPSGHAAAGVLLERAGFTALFCANDLMAVGAIARLTAAGVRVPQDLSVLGFDDSAIAPYSTPALTTVRIPIEDAAINGCRALLNLCYGTKLPVSRRFPAALAWRQSVGDGPHRRSAPTGLDLPTVD